MEMLQVRPHVQRLFPQTRPATTRIGVEHEILTFDSTTGAVVPIQRVRDATAHSSYLAHLGFEPGGQIELSLPPAPHTDLLSSRLSAAVAALRADCDSAGMRLEEEPIDPRPDAAVPLQLEMPRYVKMQRHFDSLGPAGRRMMRRTASTQICLDWWSGEAGLEQWRLLNLAGPFLAARFARSAGPESRLATWLQVDPTRTAFDDRLLRSHDPVEAYLSFALRATTFTTPGDVAQHLSTLFPPVRPRRRYLEVRFLDVQPVAGVHRVTAMLASLMYDEAIRCRALRLVAGEEARLGEHWWGAATRSDEVVALGDQLATLALGASKLEVVA